MSMYIQEVNRLLGIELPMEDVYGYHGTSVQALAHLSLHGSMPSSFGWPDEFYMVPCHDPYDESLNSQTAYDWASGFARFNAIKTHVVSCLDFTPSQEFMEQLTYLTIEGFGVSDTEDLLTQYGSSRGLTQSKLKSLMGRAEMYSGSGIVLAISRRITQEFEFTEGGTAIITSGLGIQYIEGIQ